MFPCRWQPTRVGGCLPDREAVILCRCETANMAHLHWLAYQGKVLARGNAHWMGWNLFLALAPLVLAVVLVHRRVQRHRRSVGWWAGAAAFVLLLPNAPYVVTDLIHLREDVAAAPSSSVVITSVLPLYAIFVLIGFLSYVACVELIVREVWTVARLPRWIVTAAVHAVCSVGIVLGRIARLNSWDSLADPSSTIERSFDTLAWRGAPFALITVFVAVALTHAVVRVLAVASFRWSAQIQRWAVTSRLRPARPSASA
jgi:uncharacterized membrane protein